jgi:hypothetical protein
MSSLLRSSCCNACGVDAGPAARVSEEDDERILVRMLQGCPEDERE